MRVLCLGDVVGRPGRLAVKRFVPALRGDLGIDLVIVNGENAAGGLGLDPKCAHELLSSGVDVITLGDHAWNKKEIIPMLVGENEGNRCLRPANFPSAAPGRGYVSVPGPGGARVAVINLMGRVFSDLPLDCPFRCADDALQAVEADAVIVDFHGEATSEKVAFGYYIDGRAALVVGTHTHVPTSDMRILTGGTGYVTDLGMCGPSDGVIGMDREVAVERFLKGMGKAYRIAPGPAEIHGIVADLDLASGTCTHIERLSRRLDEKEVHID